MNTEHNKQAIAKFFERFTAGDASTALTYLDDRVIWQAMGREGELPISGEMNKEGIANLIDTVKAAIPQGLHLTTTEWTAEGDRVAVEVESYGELTNGKVYNNLYHYLFEFDNGKIVKIREYMDTLHTKAIFVDD